MVEITKILPPQSQMGALEDSVRCCIPKKS